jgi:hypothetical protein
VIRRLLWLTVGAVAGVAAYRRVTRLARSVPGVLRARQVASFAADVREGMALYARQHPRPEGSTLEGQRGRRALEESSTGQDRARTDDDKDGR